MSTYEERRQERQGNQEEDLGNRLSSYVSIFSGHGNIRTYEDRLYHRSLVGERQGSLQEHRGNRNQERGRRHLQRGQ